uniref:CAM kinase, CDPK family n=1 Tax=Toxoplasma gondii (strain ATCC 50861 / VEG) TaxID=432359 RepID=A0A0F7V690_TOXGV|nr:TPA: CAM kinase, CDPK family [Toxoplasma gondii VEG]
MSHLSANVYPHTCAVSLSQTREECCSRRLRQWPSCTDSGVRECTQNALLCFGAVTEKEGCITFLLSQQPTSMTGLVFHLQTFEVPAPPPGWTVSFVFTVSC